MYHSIQKQRPDRTFSTAQRQSAAAVLQNKDRDATQLRATQTALAQEQDTPIQKQENKTGMPDRLKSNLESMSGFDMSDVRVHYNSAQPAQLQAHAYAQGTDIHIAPGQERHLPHEAWHVVQQKQGRVKPTMQLKGKVNINDNKGLEKEADVMGAKASSNSNQQVSKPIQRMKRVTNIKESDQVPVLQKKGISDVIQRKYDHLFNDIPKTLSNLPESLKSDKIDGIRDALNVLRDDNNNGTNGVHEGVDQNATDYGYAQRSFLIAADTYVSNPDMAPIALRIATHELWKYSVDHDVAGSVNNAATKISKWNKMEKETWEAMK